MSSKSDSPVHSSNGLPKNAYTPLAPGEAYVPYVPADKKTVEITRRSVLLGVAMAVVFSFSACYLGLVAGQVFEAAIPIAILAVGFATLFKRKNTILENVIIQSIGAASGVVVAGAIFTLPALYILGLKVSLWQTFVTCTLGGFLGIAFLIPMRRYFCAEEHGKLPFPEATATTEILISGESGGKSAKVLVVSMLVGGIYDFLVEAMQAWPKMLRTDVLLGGFGKALGEKFRWVGKLDASSALFGLGYIVGLRYSAVIAAGSVLSCLVLVPLIYHFGQSLAGLVPPGEIPIARMSEAAIFSTYAQKIGIGAIAMAGLINIAKMSKIIGSSLVLGLREILSGSKNTAQPPRTDRDLSIRSVSFVIIGTILFLFVAFWFFASSAGTLGFAAKVAIVGLAVVTALAFLFTPVAARATAIVGTNPVSGMTLITLIISSLILVSIGLTGLAGMAVAIMMGCVVCTALSVSGGFITDLKIGYWLGATPRNQQRWKFLGVAVASLAVSFAILLIHKAYGFTLGGGILEGGVSNPAIPAPQGNLMAAIIRSLMIQSQVPYVLYALGAVVAIVLEMTGVPPLAFALGMYLPIQINTPLFIGGLTAWFINKRSEKSSEFRVPGSELKDQSSGFGVQSSEKEKESSGSAKERGTLIASGFIAGGALMGVIGAVLNLNEIGKPIRFISVGVKYAAETVQATGKTIWNLGGRLPYFDSAAGQWISLLCFTGLCLFCVLFALRKKA